MGGPGARGVAILLLPGLALLRRRRRRRPRSAVGAATGALALAFALGCGGTTATAEGTTGSEGEASAGTTDGGSAQTPQGQGCGNRVVEFGEECDDGNLEDGDGCTRECKAPGSFTWTHTVMANDPDLDDQLHVSARGMPGEMIAVGQRRVAEGEPPM